MHFTITKYIGTSDFGFQINLVYQIKIGGSGSQSIGAGPWRAAAHNWRDVLFLSLCAYIICVWVYVFCIWPPVILWAAETGSLWLAVCTVFAWVYVCVLMPRLLILPAVANPPIFADICSSLLFDFLCLGCQFSQTGIHEQRIRWHKNKRTKTENVSVHAASADAFMSVLAVSVWVCNCHQTWIKQIHRFWEDWTCWWCVLPAAGSSQQGFETLLKSGREDGQGAEKAFKGCITFSGH